MEAFLEILRICFEPMFFVALVGVIVCLWRKEDKFINAFSGKFLAVSFFLMILWRTAYGIGSSRYGAGLILPVIIFNVYLFVNRDWLLLLPESQRKLFWRLLQTAFIILVIACFFKIYRVNDKKAYFDSIADKLRLHSKDFKHPVLIDFSNLGARLNYYSETPRLSANDAAVRQDVLKSLILKAIRQADILFFVFRKTEAESWQKKINKLYPNIALKKIFDLPGKKDSIYVWANTSSVIGKLIRPEGVCFRPDVSDAVLYENFETPIEIEISEVKLFKILQKKHVPGFERKYFKFVDSFTADGLLARDGNRLRLTMPGEPETLLGGHSIWIESVTDHVRLKLVKKLPANKGYILSLLFKGTRGAVFFFDINVFDKNNKRIIRQRSINYSCIDSQQLRSLEQSIPVRQVENAEYYTLEIMVRNGKISFDNLSILLRDKTNSQRHDE